jgi:hypothetical protein
MGNYSRRLVANGRGRVYRNVANDLCPTLLCNRRQTEASGMSSAWSKGDPRSINTRTTCVTYLGVWTESLVE